MRDGGSKQPDFVCEFNYNCLNATERLHNNLIKMPHILNQAFSTHEYDIAALSSVTFLPCNYKDQIQRMRR
jgi:hypothetical protein